MNAPPGSLILRPANRIEALAAALDEIEAFLRSWRVDEDDRRQVMIIVDEIASNIIKSAWADGGEHHVQIDLLLAPDDAFLQLKIVTADDGVAFDPSSVPPPDIEAGLDDREPGGLGLFMVTQMSDSVAYERRGLHNRLTVTKRLQRVAE